MSSPSECEREIKLTVDARDIQAEQDRVVIGLARKTTIPGFRPGKAPATVIKTRFKDNIRTEVLSHVIPHALHQAIESHKLTVVSEPQLLDVDYKEGEPLTFRARLEVLPDIKLGEYKGIEVEKELHEVTDKETEEMIAHILDQSAELVPIEDRPAVPGDFISVNLAGKHLDAKQEDISAEQVSIELGAAHVQPEFTENLVGTAPGDSKVFTVQYGPRYGAKELAGRKLEYTAVVNALRKKVLPELDDDFVRGLGEYESVGDFRKKVREDLERTAEYQATEALKQKLLEKLISMHSFPAPKSMLDRQAKKRFEQTVRAMIYQGVDPQIIQDGFKKFQEDAEEQAVRDVKGSLILERIAAAEGLQVSGEEVDAEIERLALSQGQDKTALRSRLTKEGSLGSISDKLKNTKALELVASHAVVTTRMVSESRTWGDADGSDSAEG